MSIFKGMGEYFALDIGTKSLRVVQLSAHGVDQWSLVHVGYLAVDPRVIASDSSEARKKLGQAIMSVVSQAGISATNCAVGLASNKTFTTVIEVPKMSPTELAGTLKYQADQYIPMSLDDAKLDWAVLGDSPKDPKKDEVLLASVAQTYVEGLVEMIDSLGFNVVGAEPDAVAMVRALLPDNVNDARMILDIGELSTDVIVTINSTPRLVRTLPMGLQTLTRAIVQNLNIKDEQAQQFIMKFGLAQDRLEGQVYRALQSPLENFATELVKSINFFQSKYNTHTIAAVHLSGFAAVIPRLSEYVAAKTKVPVQIASPWQKVSMPDSERQRLQTVEYEFSTAVGLAQRIER